MDNDLNDKNKTDDDNVQCGGCLKIVSKYHVKKIGKYYYCYNCLN